MRFNALMHGILSRHTVLGHEDSAEFEDLLAALVAYRWDGEHELQHDRLVAAGDSLS